MPCGIPDQDWPYTSYDIDQYNGLRYDTSTGKLWTDPKDVHDADRVSPTLYYLPGSVTAYGAMQRVNWAALYGALGGAGNTYTLSQTSLLTYTNTSNRDVFWSAAVRIPQTRWNMNFQMRDAKLQWQFLVDDAVIGTASDDMSPVSDPFTSLNNYAGGAISDRINGDNVPSEPPFADVIPAVNSLFTAANNQRFNMHIPSTITRPDLSSASTTITPGTTKTFRARLVAVTPAAPFYTVGGGLPDYPYLWNWVDINGGPYLRMLWNTRSA